MIRGMACFHRSLFLLAAWLVLASPLGLAAQEAGGTIFRRGEVADDLYLAGGRIDLAATVQGDVVAAGGRLSLGDLVRGDVLAAGGDVTVRGRVMDDVRVAGGLVAVRADVGGDVTAVGGTVSVAPQARIAGRAWLAGGEVDVQGRVARSVRAAGRTVRIGGEIDGDVILAATDVEILPTARVRGALVYRSPQEARVAPGAQIAGRIRHEPADWPAPGRAIRVIGLVMAVAILGGLAVAGIALALLLPGLAASSAQAISSAPWTSLAVGFAVLVATPAAVAVLVATLLGAPLGVALAAIYVVTLIVGLLVGVTWVGAPVTRLFRHDPSPGRVMLSVLIGLVVMAALQVIPVVGAVILMLLMILGIGGGMVHAHRLYSGQASPRRTA
jgi:cytoskeletal protein CcmA (bactofilin family)